MFLIVLGYFKIKKDTKSKKEKLRKNLIVYILRNSPLHKVETITSLVDTDGPIWPWDRDYDEFRLVSRHLTPSGLALSEVEFYGDPGPHRAPFSNIFRFQD